jgi:hypothetical protein
MIPFWTRLFSKSAALQRIKAEVAHSFPKQSTALERGGDRGRSPTRPTSWTILKPNLKAGYALSSMTGKEATIGELRFHQQKAPKNG